MRARSIASILAAALALVIAPVAEVRAEPPASLGPSSDAQPGLYRVALAWRTQPAVGVSSGYGYTERLEGAPGASHRMAGRLAGAFGVLPWLNMAGVFDARYDRHSGDSGTMLDGGLALRGGSALGKMQVGAELKAWVPGSEEIGTTFRATSFDVRGLFSAHLPGALLALNAGYRLDRSAEAGERAPRLAFGDRAALGLSDFDAILIGAGVAVPAGRIHVLAELSANVLIGSGAPPFTESPLHATVGGRTQLSERLSVEILVDGSLSRRPAVGPTEPLIPIDPRLGGLVGLRYRFVERKPEVAAAPPPDANSVARPIAAPAAQPAARPVDAPFEVTLTDEDGAPVRDAEITIQVGNRTEVFTSDRPGVYRNDHVPEGVAKLAVKAPGFEPFEQDLTVEPGKSVRLPAKLKALPPPSQVRGTVRSYGGKPLTAKVRVDPLGLETMTDETGAFQVDVTPGSYEVTIQAEGYESQRRLVRVDAEGVVILNADLVRKK